MGVKIEFKGVKPEDLMERIEKAAGYEVLVGIPSDRVERDDNSELNNAELAAIHERGNPAGRLPARPFMVPGIERASAVIGPIVEKAAVAAVKGESVTAYLEDIGEKVESSIKKVFTDNNWAPLKPISILARAWRHLSDNASYKSATPMGKRKQFARELARRANDRPLLDTGALQGSIKHIVRKVEK